MSMPVCLSQRLSPSDPNSYALPEEAKVTDMDLRWTVDFKNQRLKGSVILTVQKADPAATHLTLDAKRLDIERAVDNKTGQELQFSVGEEGYVGSKLQIQLPITGIFTESKSIPQKFLKFEKHFK